MIYLELMGEVEKRLSEVARTLPMDKMQEEIANDLGLCKITDFEEEEDNTNLEKYAQEIFKLINKYLEVLQYPVFSLETHSLEIQKGYFIDAKKFYDDCINITQELSIPEDLLKDIQFKIEGKLL